MSRGTFEVSTVIHLMFYAKKPTLFVSQAYLKITIKQSYIIYLLRNIFSPKNQFGSMKKPTIHVSQYTITN